MNEAIRFSLRLWITASLFAAALPAIAVETAPRISDREIIESLAELKAGQKALEAGQKALEAGQKALEARIDQRFEAFQAMVETQGIEVKSVYYTQGQCDMVVILEGADEAAMVSSLKLLSLGNVRTQTMRAFSVDEMKGFISKMP